MIEVGGVTLPPVPVKPSTPSTQDPDVDFPAENYIPSPQKPLSKTGSTYTGSETITWNLAVNFDNLLTAAVHSNPAITPLKNAVIEDTLETVSYTHLDVYKRQVLKTFSLRGLEK